MGVGTKKKKSQSEEGGAATISDSQCFKNKGGLSHRSPPSRPRPIGSVII